MTIRIAMWSGPRNISTAMMRSWENRPDCSVVDEPFYAYYLHKTRSPHPLFDEVVASQSVDFTEVAKNMVSAPCDTPVQYQKQMTHHMLPGCDLTWTKSLKHCFLIRQPAYIINSYTNSRGVCTSEDIGIVRQYELFQAISEISGQAIPVIESDSVLQDPQGTLKCLCKYLEVPFLSSMLAWPQGRRVSDGIWAKHWYHSVEGSTGFAPPSDKAFQLTTQQQKLADEMQPYYEKMQRHVLSDSSE